MTREIITDVLLALSVLTVAGAALGIAIMPDAYARLHFVAPAAVVAPVLVTLAVFVREGLDYSTGETFIALVFMVAASPFLSHATVRAIRVRERGDWHQAAERPAETSAERPAEKPADGPRARVREPR